MAGYALGKRGGVSGDGFGVGFTGVWSCTAVLEGFDGLQRWSRYGLRSVP